MKKHVFLDTDIVLDMALAERAGHQAGLQMLDTIEREGYRASVCASAIPYIYNELEPIMGEDDAALYIQAMCDAFDIYTVDEATIRQALTLTDEPNLDAAILRICAELSGADSIVSNDKFAFRNSPIKKVKQLG